MTTTHINSPQQATTSPRWSSHACQGSNCIFHNLCILNGEYVYHAKDNQSALDLVDFLERQQGKSLHLISTIEENLPDPTVFLMKIRIELEQLDQHLELKLGNYTELRRYYSGNVGHTLGDDVFAIFRGVHSWGFDVVESNLKVFLDHLDATEVFKVITRNEVVLRPKINLCYETFYAGWQGLGFVALSAAEMETYDGRNQKPEFSKRLGGALQSFRNTAWRVLDIESSSPCITLVVKDLKHSEHPYYIDNMEDIFEAVSKAWSGCVQQVSWFGMPIKEQVTTMANSVAVLTLPGSDCMNAVFLPDNSRVVVPDRRAKGVWQGSNEYRNWFKHAYWLRFDSYRPFQDPLYENKIHLNVTDTVNRLLGR